MHHTKDIEIRAALHRKVLHLQHSCPNTLVIDELGLAHGKTRIDVAVLNGCLHGYEIKSSKDTLLRLPDQLDEYKKSLEKLTIVCAENHMSELSEVAPNWCGLTLASKGPKGGISFKIVRRPLRNPHVCAVSMAHLLWRSEAVSLLKKHGVEERILKGSRLKLYEHLSTMLSVEELTAYIKEQFMKRETWRVAPEL